MTRADDATPSPDPTPARLRRVARLLLRVADASAPLPAVLVAAVEAAARGLAVRAGIVAGRTDEETAP